LKEVTWTPSPYDVPIAPTDKEWDKEKGADQTKSVESPFEGQVIYNMPLYTNRLKYLKECNFSSGEDVKASGANYDSMIRMVDICKKHIVKVALKVKCNGEEIKSLEELELYQEGGDALNQIATCLLRGVKLGEN